MKIKEVEKITELTQKAIRLYETKGLIKVSRDENGYRNYSDENVETLKSIKLFRSIGVSVTDIKLYLFGVITLDEMIDKRRSEILKESGQTSAQYRFCGEIAEKLNDKSFKSDFSFSETSAEITDFHGELSVGIDIGTTTVSAVVIDIEKRQQLESFTIVHKSNVCTQIMSEQSVSAIMEKSEKLLYHILSTYQNVVSIGISGQMHGIVYINTKGDAVSNLINWQDKRAEQPIDNGETACERIKRITGDKISTGYGIATHYYNLLNNTVPPDAVGFCSIMDLFAMKICNLTKPIIHSSVADSFGLFDVKYGNFKKEKLSLLGINDSFLPEVTNKSIVVGECKGIPVSVAIGDNQASILGAVGDNTSAVLVNIGTGSQISAVCEYCETVGDTELRPFIEGKYVICGAALCGGLAYAMLEDFFSSYTASAGMQPGSQYNVMNKLATKAYEEGKEGLMVDVSFCGKRSNPECRGSIQMIDRHNFTPDELILGVLKGVCNELYEFYGEASRKKTDIVASGGAVRKIDLLKKLLADKFGGSVFVNTNDEEAATGAALFSAFAVGKVEYNNGFSDFINYEE